MMSLTITIFFLVLVLIWCVIIYNRLVRDKNRVYASWSDIDVQLKRRHELIPKLVDVVKSYTQYESNTLDEITRLRTQSSSIDTPKDKSQAENHLTNSLKKLLVIMENYPELKASEQYLSLQTNLSEVENDIQSARRFYNGAVRNLNIRIDSFPDLFIARAFNYKQSEFFELDSVLESLPPEIKS